MISEIYMYDFIVISERKVLLIMYLNYAEENICLNGRLIRQSGKREYEILTVDPYKGNYKVAKCFVKLNSKFINDNYEEIRMFAGLYEDYSAADLALAAVNYYGPETFARPDDVYIMTKEDLKEYISNLDCEDPVVVE